MPPRNRHRWSQGERAWLECCRSSGMVLAGGGRDGAAVGMLWFEFDAPHRTQILHLGLDALNVEPNGAAIGKMQGDVAFRGGGRLEGDGEQGQHQALVAEIDRLHLSTEHALKANGGAAAHVSLACLCG